MNSGIIKSCHWEITRKCNLSCIHCISSAGKKKDLDNDSMLRVIDVLDNWGCKEIYFTGGEPLVKKKIFSIFKKATENEMKIALLSNGTLINKRNIKLINKYIDEIGISLDGSCPEINGLIRGKRVFKKVISSIKLLKKHRISLSLYITICKLNINDLENILVLADSLKVNNVRVNEISLRGRAYKNRKMLAFNKEGKTNLKKQLFEIFGKSSYQDRDFLLSDSCEVNNENIFISPSGFIYPCIEIYQQKPNNHLGNILKISKEGFKKRRKTYTKSKPKKCPYRFLARGDFALCLNNPSIECKFIK